jgi:hypothetical protein
MLIVALGNPDVLARLRRWRPLGRLLTLRIDAWDSVAEGEVVDHLYASLYVRDGLSKKTTRGRLSDLDDRTLGLLSREGDACIHDVGVSSGVTSLDLFESLRRAGRPFRLFVSDPFSRFYSCGRAVCRVYDRDRRLVRAYVGSVVLDERLSWKYFVSRYGFALLKRLPPDRRAGRPIVLYDARVRALIEQGRIGELDYDVFGSRVETAFDFVRCMNLLTRAHFPAARIAEGLRNLTASLKEGGVLQVGKTTLAGVNEVSFFRRVGGRLRRVQDVNGGWEASELAV